MSAVVNALTVDVEDWYHVHTIDIPVSRWQGCADRVGDTTRELLAVLSRHGVKGTFFVLGHVADRHPALVREIAGEGHELGSHGYWHRLVYRQTPAEFRADVRKARACLEDVIAAPVFWYRAPSWSIGPKSLWALEILEDEGFKYDSSIFPVKTPLFGVSGVPHHPFRPRVGARELALWELPPPPLRLGGINIPFTGGMFMRLCPHRLLLSGIRRLNATGRPALVYVHPWELQRLPVSSGAKWRRWLQEVNVHSVEAKLNSVLREFLFAPAGEVLEAHRRQWPTRGQE
ncbi:MAG: DUF3473 domain-containing protein [bacterium]|nr:DUF3473 domain-containing protein [bacterium]